MECSSGLSMGTKAHAQWGANGGKPFQNDRRRLISIKRDRLRDDSVSRNVRADFLKNDLFNLLREALGDFQVSQDMA